MKWWRAQGKKNQGWLYFAFPEKQDPHKAATAVLGPLRALESVEKPPRLIRLGKAADNGHELELYREEGP